MSRLVDAIVHKRFKRSRGPMRVGMAIGALVCGAGALYGFAAPGPAPGQGNPPPGGPTARIAAAPTGRTGATGATGTRGPSGGPIARAPERPRPVMTPRPAPRPVSPVTRARLA